MTCEVVADEALLGRTIAGKYRIDEFLGGGAMGAVYKARQLALDKSVAVKVLHREIQKDKQFAARFKREAKAASRLDHPNSLRVLDFGEEPDGLLYMAMELLDGVDLFTLHREQFPLPAGRVANILSQALAALAVAHDQGVIHRDLKPENIMVLAGKDDEGRAIDVVKVCDFGIAKIVEERRGPDSIDQSGRLSTGLIVGTPEYMSPEQGRGEELDPRADIYAMGVILYQLLAGDVPFEAENVIGVVLKHVTEEPKRPSSMRPDVDPRLEEIALKAMQKRKEARFASAREMRAALRPLQGAGSSASFSEVSRSFTPTDMESAATVAIPAPALTAQEPKSTLSTAAIDEEIRIPERRPSWVAIVIAPLVVGALSAIAYTSLTRKTKPVIEAISASVSVAPPFSAAASASAAPSASIGVEKPKPKPVVAPVNPPPIVAAKDAGAEIIDPEKARVVAVAVRAQGATEDAVRAAVDVGKLTVCYRSGLRAPSAKGRAFQQTLEIGTDAAGIINYAAMPAPEFLSSLQSCWVKTLIGVKIAGASDAKAHVDLAFNPR